MRFHSASLIAFAVLSVSTVSGTRASEELLRLLPENTEYAVMIEDFSEAWQRNLATVTRQEGDAEHSNDGVWEACGVEPGDLAAESVSEVLRTETREPSGAGGRMIVANGGDEARASRILSAANTRLTAAGATSTQVELGKTVGTRYTWHVEEGSAPCVIHCRVGKLIFCANNVALAERVVEVAGDTSNIPATGHPSRPELLSSFPPRRADDRLRVICYSNPWAGLDTLEAIGAEDQASLDRARRHGLDGIQASCRLLALGPAGLLRSYAIVLAPKPYHGTLQLLQLKETPAWEIPPWIPDDFSEFTLLHGDIPGALEHVGSLFDDLYADGIEGTYDDILTDLNDEYGLGIDLKDALYQHLGPRVILLRGPAPTAATETPGAILIAFQTGQPDKVATTLRMLMEDDPEVTRTQVPGCEQPLWKIQADETLSDSGVMVARGYLIFAQDVAMIHQALAAKGESARRLTLMAEGLQSCIDWPGTTSPCILLARGDDTQEETERLDSTNSEKKVLEFALFGSSNTLELRTLAAQSFDVTVSKVIPYRKGSPLAIGYATDQGIRFYSETKRAAER